MALWLRGYIALWNSVCNEEHLLWRKKDFPREFKNSAAFHALGTCSRVCLHTDHRHLIHGLLLWYRLALLHAVASHCNV